MLEREAARLFRILAERRGVSPLLNLGSSTRHFREAVQPHVERELFEPLRAAGVAIRHSDLKQGDGVDLAGDILEPEFAGRLKAKGFRCILAANLLEHVRDRAAVAAACEEIVGPGGLILATAPASYPWHADPIDTGYRPSPAELAALFARSEPVLVEELVGPTYGEQLRKQGSSVPRELARTLWWMLTAPIRPRGAASRVHRWLWYARPYRVSIALVRVAVTP